MADVSKKIYQVEVAGEPLKLRSSHDQQTVDELVGLVNKKVGEVMSVGGNVSYHTALLLAALHMAEELTLLKKSAISEIEKIEERARDILSELESSPASQIPMDV